MQLWVADDTGADLDHYLGNFAEYPLLDGTQERDATLRMRVAARACLRLLWADTTCRELLIDFVQTVCRQAPAPEHFAHRARYFQLRRVIGELGPSGKRADAMQRLLRLMQDHAPQQQVMRAIDAAAWPAPLTIGITAIVLRALGDSARDATADALLDWQPHRAMRAQPPDLVLRNNLLYAVKRYTANRDRLVLHNMRLVYKLARAHSGRGVALRDLVQEGCGGLIRAAEKYDYRLGYRFSTYAYNWINQYLQRACEGNGSLIDMPSHVLNDINRLHSERQREFEKTGREPALRTLADLTGLPQAKVHKLRQLGNLTVGIEQPVSGSTQMTWGDTLADPQGESGPIAMQNTLLRRLVSRRVSCLSDMEQAVVRGRYGLSGLEPQTFRQLADQLDISSEWARQLERSALAKLRDDSGLLQAFSEIEN